MSGNTPIEQNLPATVTSMQSVADPRPLLVPPKIPARTFVPAKGHGLSKTATAVGIVFTCLFLAPGSTSAQVEVVAGASVGRGCKSGYEPCGGLLVGAQGGIWIDDSIGLRLRLANIRSNDIRWDHGDFTIVSGNRKRLLLTGELLYRFKRGRRVQPIAGIAIGGRQERDAISCERISCADAAAALGPQFPRADYFPVHFSTGVVGGVLFKPAPRLTIEALLGLHDFPTEHGATAEGTVLVGVRLWRSRGAR